MVLSNTGSLCIHVNLQQQPQQSEEAWQGVLQWMQDLKRQGKEWTGPDHLATVVPAVLNSLVDADARVRYYACEALYNIAKMSREDFLAPHFNSTFDALFRLVADPDAAVNQACTFLDSLMKVGTASSMWS